MSNDIDPAEALASIKAARAEVGKTMDYPIAWDFVFGLIIAAMVAGQGLPTQWSTLVLIFSILGLIWMMKWWRDRFGWWVNGYGPRKARWVSFGLAAVLFACMGLSLWTRHFDGPWWAPVAAGGIAFVTSIVFGRWWMAVYRRELAELGE